MYIYERFKNHLHFFNNQIRKNIYSLSPESNKTSVIKAESSYFYPSVGNVCHLFNEYSFIKIMVFLNVNRLGGLI
ncbi:hypothetical protein OKW24_003121 [Peribacillus simplex]|nr:hypothetical protein [Peribacillus simplex]